MVLPKRRCATITAKRCLLNSLCSTFAHAGRGVYGICITFSMFTPLEKIVLVIFGIYLPRRLRNFWAPPPLNVSGKGKNQNQLLRKPREITNASAAKQKPEPTPSQKQKRGRPAASARQERPQHITRRTPAANIISQAVNIWNRQLISSSRIIFYVR